MTTRILRFFGHAHREEDWLGGNGEASIVVTLNHRPVFNGTITQSRGDYLFQTHDIPLDFSGSLPMTVSVTSGTLSMGDVQITHDRIPNPIYNHEILGRFRSAETWAEKVSILCELANPVFSQEQIEFLLLEDPEHWAAQEKILNQHGCELTVLGPDSWREANRYDGDPDDYDNVINDVRQNVTLNGVLQVVPRGPGLNGTWSWAISSGDVLCCDLIISPTPAFRDISKNILWPYILPGLTMDFLNEIQLINELKRPDIKILDIGTGDGEILEELRKIHVQGQVHGLDTPNTEYKLNVEYDEFIEADLRYPLPMQDNTYDIIVCSNVFIKGVMELENTPPLTEDCLDEILRVITPGGIFIFHIDRVCWREFDRKIKQLINSDQISVIGQKWMRFRENMQMFPLGRLCLAVRKH